MKFIDNHIESKNTAAWYGALATFGAGDMITTTIGINHPEVREIGPGPTYLLDLPILQEVLILKTVTLIILAMLWMEAPEGLKLPIPLALMFVGLVVTIWNIAVLYTAFF